MAPKVAHLGGFMAETCVELSRDFLKKDPAQICMDWAAPVLLVPVWYWDVVKTGALAFSKVAVCICQFWHAPGVWLQGPGYSLRE